MPYPNEASCRLSSPSKYSTFRRGTRKHNGKTYSVIYGKLKGENKWKQQAFRYSSKTWTNAAAKAHCKAHKGIKFEPATGVKTMELSVQLREGESYQDRSEAVAGAIREAVIPAGSSDWYVYVSDLYENMVVYEVTQPDQERGYFQVSYIIGEDLKAAIGEPVAVKRKVTYTTLEKERDMEKSEKDGIITAMKEGIEKGFNSLKSLIIRGGEPMDKEQLIALLQESDAELDKELLENTDEKLLKYMVEHLKPAENEEPPVETPVETPKDEEPDELDAKIEAQIETHLKTKYPDFDQIKTHMDTMAAETEAAKKKLVDSLVANKQCTIDKDALEELSPETLRQLNAQFEPGSYLGVGAVRTNMEAIPRPPSILLVNKKDGE